MGKDNVYPKTIEAKGQRENENIYRATEINFNFMILNFGIAATQAAFRIAIF